MQEATGHVELAPHWNVAAGTWQWLTDWLDDDLNYHTDPVETICFPGLDTSPTSYGVRYNRPSDSKWDFLGMAAGEPVWIFTDTSYCSAGFASTQSELTGNVIISLDGFEGPDRGSFSMYTGSTPNIYMQTIDGISAADKFPKSSAHTHVNWAFSRKGLWVVRLKAQGTLASNGNPTAISPAAPLVFAIGDHARWKATHFPISELSTPSISGDAADPDGDGWNNLMEYALGGDPHVASTLREDDGQPLAPRLLPPESSGAPWKFCYFRRVAASGVDISYGAESSTSIDSPPWNLETASEEILSSEGVWEQICIPLSMPQVAADSCFFRLKVSSIP